jgi:hypothetical protein
MRSRASREGPAHTVESVAAGVPGGGSTRAMDEDPIAHAQDLASHAPSVREEPAGRPRRVASPSVREGEEGRARHTRRHPPSPLLIPPPEWPPLLLTPPPLLTDE